MSESTSLPLASNEPPTPPPARSESTSLFASDSANGPFRYVEPSGETPKHVKDDPFETAVMESINVGSVTLHMPRLTDPIALCTGFSMKAEVVKHTSKFAKFRKAQRRAFPERESKAEEPGGGLFFASRTLGRSPAVCKATLSSEVLTVRHTGRSWMLRKRSVPLIICHQCSLRLTT
jgi:hypothetical protein